MIISLHLQKEVMLAAGRVHQLRLRVVAVIFLPTGDKLKTPPKTTHFFHCYRRIPRHCGQSTSHICYRLPRAGAYLSYPLSLSPHLFSRLPTSPYLSLPLLSSPLFTSPRRSIPLHCMAIRGRSGPPRHGRTAALRHFGDLLF